MFLRRGGGAVSFGMGSAGGRRPFASDFDDNDDFGGGFGGRAGFGNDRNSSAFGGNRRGFGSGDDYSPLFLACEAGDYTSVFRLLNQGMNPNISDSKLVRFSFFFHIIFSFVFTYLTPLHIASRSGNTKIVQELLNFRANPNAQTQMVPFIILFIFLNFFVLLMVKLLYTLQQ